MLTSVGSARTKITMSLKQWSNLVKARSKSKDMENAPIVSEVKCNRMQMPTIDLTEASPGFIGGARRAHALVGCFVPRRLTVSVGDFSCGGMNGI